MKKISGIYIIRCLVNEKVYVGGSGSLKNRWRTHISSLNKNKHHSKELQNDFNKFGKENFEFQIIEQDIESEELRNEKEESLIQKLNSRNEKYGYNSAKKPRKTSFGIKRTPKQLEEMRNRNKGKKLSEETKRKLSEATKGEKGYWFGKTFSEDHKEKLKEARKHQVITEENRKKKSEAMKKKQRIGSKSPVSKLKESDVVRIKRLLNEGMRVIDIAKEYEISHSVISNIKNGKRWTHVK